MSGSRGGDVQRNMNSALIDFYRCPGQFVPVQLAGPLSEDSGYFRFGPNAVCYGRSSAGTRRQRPEDVAYDALVDTVGDRTPLRIPFDITEIIDNLRLERYAPSNRVTPKVQIRRRLKDVYYLLRPLIPDQIRTIVQRADLKGWESLQFPRWPVDTTVENLCEQLLAIVLGRSGIEEIPFVWFWPEGAQACIAMTHDVETRKGMDFCSELMNIDKSFGMPASFQIVPEGRYPQSEAFAAGIRERGFEVNIQDLNHDGNLFRDRAEFLRRAEQINRYGRLFAATGFRAAILYRNLEWLEALQFSFDMSVPNVAHLDPQKGGCCTVFPYFIGGMVEIPVTTTQDYMLFRLLRDYSLDLWKQQSEIILKKNGLISFIVHPDYIIEKQARGLYVGLLEYLRDFGSRHKAWFALPGEIDRWWRARQHMRIVNAGGIWRIEGDGAERAVLALARLKNGKIQYELTAGCNQLDSPGSPAPTMSKRPR